MIATFPVRVFGCLQPHMLFTRRWFSAFNLGANDGARLDSERKESNEFSSKGDPSHAFLGLDVTCCSSRWEYARSSF